MRYLKNFKLFEAVKPQHILPTSINDLDSFINYSAFIESGIAKGNYYQDFRMWLVYSALKEALKDDSFFYYRDELKGRENEIEALIDYPAGYQKGSDHYREELDKFTKDTEFKTETLLEAAADSIKYLQGQPKTVSDPEISKAVRNAMINTINFYLGDVFYPGKMKIVKDLKFLDGIDESVFVKEALLDVVNHITTEYAKMERNPIHLGSKFFQFLKAIGESEINALINIEFPEFFVDTIINYFKEAEDTFKVADEIRKSNPHIYDKIKQFLPNIDTAADLGDLGF